MTKTLQYTVITPERIVKMGEAEAITLMTMSGEITILPHHIPLLALMKAGEMRITHAGEEEHYATSTGMVEVRHDGTVVVLADTAELSEELNLVDIEAAKKRAEETLIALRNQNDISYADAAAHLERELARYRVVMKKRRASKASS
jgi:F-type H+-transporting ATPase subunit epsilon